MNAAATTTTLRIQVLGDGEALHPGWLSLPQEVLELTLDPPRRLSEVRIRSQGPLANLRLVFPPGAVLGISQASYPQALNGALAAGSYATAAALVFGALYAVVLFAVAAAIPIALRRLRRSQGGTLWFRIAAASGIVGVAVQSLWETGLRIPANALLFAVLAAVLLHDKAPNRIAPSTCVQ